MGDRPAYTATEYVDMLIIYGESGQNCEEAARVYAERYPDRRHPWARVFTRLITRARETGKLVPDRQGAGRPRRARTVRAEEEILHLVHEDPTTSCRAIAEATQHSKSTVHRVLKQENLYPFHRVKVQKLHPGDRERRVQFCRYLLDLHAENPDVLERVLWTDEATFHRLEFSNHYNSHYYSVENPHLTESRSFQRRWKINVWGGILGNRVLLHMLPETMNGARYYGFLTETLPFLLDQVEQQEQPTWFQHDGAPPHNVQIVSEHLNATYPGRWFGYRGPVEWPARSPDLTPLDFFLWGYIKGKVFDGTQEEEDEDEEEDQEDRDVRRIVARIHAAVAEITPEMLREVRENLLLRARTCIEAGGDNFEQLLK